MGRVRTVFSRKLTVHVNSWRTKEEKRGMRTQDMEAEKKYTACCHERIYIIHMYIMYICIYIYMYTHKYIYRESKLQYSTWKFSQIKLKN